MNASCGAYFQGGVKRTSSRFLPKLKLWGSNAPNLQMSYKVHRSTVLQNNVGHMVIFDVLKFRNRSVVFFSTCIICVFQKSQIHKTYSTKTVRFWCIHFFRLPQKTRFLTLAATMHFVFEEKAALK